ncbi:porphobilinogen synthase [Fusibacter bizertensis]
MKRFRRYRMQDTLRQSIRENTLNKEELITPVFVIEGENIKTATEAMPDLYRYSLDRLPEELETLIDLGLFKIILFGVPKLKDAMGSQAYDEEGIVQKAIRMIKAYDSRFYIITDICLCQYTDHGHCGVINAFGEVENDQSVELISRIALSHASAGADMVAPSDMMDGRIAGIRKILDDNGFVYLPILSYSLKYCSNYYGPFRAIADSKPQFGSRDHYQMDYHNSRNAADVAREDIAQGADLVMVKPAMVYLDIVHHIRTAVNVPIVVYNVSGEYALLSQGIKSGMVNENIIYETMIGFKRAGADLIITYFSKELVNKWL